jgi:ABC-type hemin transport system substrate-binding protein
MATLADDIAALVAAGIADDQAARAHADATARLQAVKDRVNTYMPDSVPFVLPDGSGRLIVKGASGLYIGAPKDPSTVPIP